MLPSLIFGGLTDGFSPDDTNMPILNDNITIVRNVNDVSFSISSILSEGIDDVISRIEKDFASTDADGKEVVNPYKGNLISNVINFIN